MNNYAQNWIRLGSLGQVSERADVHLAKNVAAPNRKLEVGHGYLKKLLQRLAVYAGLRQPLRRALRSTLTAPHQTLPELGTAKAEADVPEARLVPTAAGGPDVPGPDEPGTVPENAVGGRLNLARAIPPVTRPHTTPTRCPACHEDPRRWDASIPPDACHLARTRAAYPATPMCPSRPATRTLPRSSRHTTQSRPAPARCSHPGSPGPRRRSL